MRGRRPRAERDRSSCSGAWSTSRCRGRGGARRVPLPAAGDDPPVRPRTPGRGRRDPASGGSPPRLLPRRGRGRRPEGSGRALLRAAEIELDNLRAALASGLRDEPRAALRTAVALWPLWMRRGYFTEGSRLLEAALAADPAPTPLRARGLRGRIGARGAPGATGADHRPGRGGARDPRRARATRAPSRARCCTAGCWSRRGPRTPPRARPWTRRSPRPSGWARRSWPRSRVTHRAWRRTARGDDDEARRLIEEGLDLLAAPTGLRQLGLGDDHRPGDRPRRARADPRCTSRTR